jgi:hypothetical protein
MREKGLPQVLTWRWAPCAAFVLGAISFAAFMLLAIPDHIGQVPAEATSDSLRFQLARTQAAVTPQSDWSSETTNTASATPRLADRSAIHNGVSTFPKRGFSPPLERADPPPAPVPVAPPPMPPQPQLNLPPPVPPPVEQPPAPSPAQPEVPPPAQAVPPPPDAQAAQPPQSN